MFKKMKHTKNEKGLTLIELLAVIVILAIIAAIAIPAIGNIINNTRDKAILSDVQSALASAKIAKADGSCTDTATGTTCTGTEIEFESDKLNIATIVFTNATTGTSPTPASVTITAVIPDGFNGTRLSNKITTGTGAGTISDATAPATGKQLVITESKLIDVLGGN